MHVFTLYNKEVSLCTVVFYANSYKYQKNIINKNVFHKDKLSFYLQTNNQGDYSMTNRFDKIYSLDTNIILDDARNFITLSEEGTNLIVLPETVLDEIDSKKSGFDEINFQAREFGRLLYDATIDNKTTIEINDQTITVIETTVENTIIHIVSKEKYVADSDNTSSSIRNDRKILEITKEILEHGYDGMKFISLDVMARTRAISLGIETEAMNLGTKDIELEFIKYIDLDKGDVLVNGAPITDYDEDYKPNNFSYVFSEFGTNRKYLVSVQFGKVSLLEENELRKQNVNPMNTEQLFFSNALLSAHYDIIVVEAKAGSGKTLLAVSAAMELIKKKEYQRIVYIRNSVESLAKGEEVGYLSTNEAKFEIYNFPLFDTLSYIAAKMLNNSKENKPGKGEFITEERISEKTEELVEKYQIETMWTGAMRGRTLSNAIVIMDETQNMANATMQLAMSRIDASCKVVILGSNRQIDNQYITKHTNGLTTLLNATKDEHEEVNLFGIELQKVLRGPVTQFAERVFSKD